jgi:hypothetical protein
MANKKMIAMTLILGLVALATGCSDSTTAPVTTPDTAPPTPAGNLSIAYVDGVATLSWDIEAVDADLAGYVVTREHNGATVVLLEAPTLVTTVDDTNAELGASIYHVYAVDTTGNESAPSTTQLLLTGSHADDNLAD